MPIILFWQLCTYCTYTQPKQSTTWYHICPEFYLLDSTGSGFGPFIFKCYFIMYVCHEKWYSFDWWMSLFLIFNSNTLAYKHTQRKEQKKFTFFHSCGWCSIHKKNSQKTPISIFRCLLMGWILSNNKKKISHAIYQRLDAVELNWYWKLSHFKLYTIIQLPLLQEYPLLCLVIYMFMRY